MTNKELADIIFPDIHKSIDDIEKMYPERKLDKDALVTRFAPSPTGYVHIGNMLQAVLDYYLAKNSNGIFYLRNEDTDTKREVKDSFTKIMEALRYMKIEPDEYNENGCDKGEYGPYIQSDRKEIYHIYIKHLIEIGRAYPCFCTEDELAIMHKKQEAKKAMPGYYGAWAKCRFLSNEERIKRISNNEEYVIRFKSEGNPSRKIVFNDLVTGQIEFPENNNDMVIMKSKDRLPTYHFAHVIDDHLMHTTHVVRGQEWLPSIPLHLEMFASFGFTPPKYIHNSLLLKQEDGVKRKISKRKDPEALMSYYIEKGYPSEAIIESLMTILNSNYEEWRETHENQSYLDFTFDPKKVGTTGALYDLSKLDNISKNIISKMSKDELYNNLTDYLKIYDKSFLDIISKDKDYTKSILNIERETIKPRKDYVCYADIKNGIWYMYEDLFDNITYEWMKITDKIEINKILTTYINKYYDENDDKETWFNKIKAMTDELGYCSNMKEYKKNPDMYKGNVADISTVLRVALTSKNQTPDLYDIMHILGSNIIKSRFNRIIK